jgi:hypothetical protein
MMGRSDSVAGGQIHGEDHARSTARFALDFTGAADFLESPAHVFQAIGLIGVGGRGRGAVALRRVKSLAVVGYFQAEPVV